MKGLHMVSFVLLIAGGLNWLLVGAFEYNLVDSVFGSGLGMWIYILVGLSAIYEAATHGSRCKECKGSGSM